MDDTATRGRNATKDPVDRVAEALRRHGWDVLLERYGKRASYVATRGAWTVIVVPAILGGRADLHFRRPDGVWLLPPFCDSAEYERGCRLVGIEPRDLWRSDIVADLEEAA